MPNTAQKSPDSPADPMLYLSLGSNVGDRESNLREAVERMKSLGLEITRASSVYETEPVGAKDQPWFLNQVIEARVDLQVTVGDASKTALIKAAIDEGKLEFATSLWVYELHRALQGIELEMGRKRSNRGEPRVIDIDILLCGELEGFWAESRGDSAAAAGPLYLNLPHPRMHERRFVLEPLCEIAADVIHPVLKKTCRQLLADLNDQSRVIRVDGTQDADRRQRDSTT